jgi:hypothetical protein
MTLNAVADFLEQSPAQEDREFKLRVGLGNLETGNGLGHISKTALKRRCDLLVEEFEKRPHKDRATLWNCLVGTMDDLWEFDHYERHGDLASHLDCRAVTVQSDANGAAGTWWLQGRPQRAKFIARAFARNQCSGTVGTKKSALWLTPYRGEIAELCDKAKQTTLTQLERNRIATRIRDKLGLYRNGSGESLLAFVTKKPIGALGFVHGSNQRSMPVGPSAVEARTYLRFRPWPRPTATDTYGRTFDLDATERRTASPSRHHGAEESVRPLLDMDEFEECIYLGDIMQSAPESDANEFLTEIGSTRDVVSVLRRLAMILQA